MYQDIGAMWEGFIKWVYSVAALSRAALVGLLIAGYLFFLAPFYWLWNDYFIVAAPTAWRPIVIFQVVVILAMRRLINSRFKEPIVSTILHPVGFSFLFLASLYAASRQAVGAGVRWKKRLYSRESLVE